MKEMSFTIDHSMCCFVIDNRIVLRYNNWWRQDDGCRHRNKHNLSTTAPLTLNDITITGKLLVKQGIKLSEYLLIMNILQLGMIIAMFAWV